MAEVVFWMSAGVALYVLLVFPGVLALRAWLFPRRLQFGDVAPSISVVIAAYNEERCIAERIENILSCEYRGPVEILVASDGSTDGTDRIVEQYADRGVKLLTCRRGGKGQALNRAAPNAGGELLVFTDANTVFAVDALQKLARPFADPTVGGVAGNQIYTRGSSTSLTADGERAYWTFDTLLKRLQSRGGNATSATGAIYAIRRSLYQPVPPDAMDDFIISTGVIAQGYRLVFEPEAQAFEPVAVKEAVEFSRKRRVIMQGLRSVIHQRRLLNPFRFGFYSVQFFTHKLLRRLLWLPLLAVMAVLPLLWPSGQLYRACAVSAAAFLALATFGRLLRPWRIGRSKLLTVPCYLCMVQIAAALATIGTVVGRRVQRWEPERHALSELQRLQGNAGEGFAVYSGAQLGRLLSLAAAAIVCGLLLAKFPLPLVLGASAAMIAVALLMRPDRATLIFVFVLYANVPVVAVRFHGVPGIAAAGTIGLLLLPLAYHVLHKRREIVLPKVTGLIVLFAIVQIVSAVWADQKETAMDAALTTILEGLVLFLLLVNVIRTPEMLRRVTWALVLAGTFLGGIGVVQKATGSYGNNYGGFAQLPRNERGKASAATSPPRAAGPIGEKNYFAQFLSMLAPLVLFRFWNEQTPRLRWLAAVSAGLILSGIALTASRGAVMGMAAMLAALLALRCISFRQVGLIAAVGVLLVLSTPGYRERLAELGGLAEVAQGETSIRQTDKSLQGRLSEIAAAAIIFRENPLIGVGPGNFPVHFLDKAHALGFQIHGEERLAHCAILEIAAETGILGVICIVSIFVLIFRQLIAARRVTRREDVRMMIDASLVALVVLVATSLFLSFAYVRYYWLMLAVAAAAARFGFDNAPPRHNNRPLRPEHLWKSSCSNPIN